ncbi:MAG: IS1595 family transposase, partial [Kordia sp.]
FDEFCFRINRSQFKDTIFHKTIERMVFAKPIYHKNIKQTLSV